MKIFKIILTIIFCLYVNNLFATTLNNGEKVNKISKNLRCLICQGQSVYDSQSDFAISMKILINKKINEGKSEKEIYDFLINQYGEWIVYDTKFNNKTFFLWIFPLILFVFGGFLIIKKAFINNKL